MAIPRSREEQEPLEKYFRGGTKNCYQPETEGYVIVDGKLSSVHLYTGNGQIKTNGFCFNTAFNKLI